jgi:hypothetical protein
MRRRQFIARSAAAAVLLVAFSHGGAPAQTAASARSTADRTDDLAGYQIHVMYVLPSDGMDYNLDTGGAIASSVAAAQKWFEVQTRGRRLRFDTSNGALDISFFRLARTDAAIAGSGAYVRDQIQSEINAAGFNHPEKIYAVYYGGSSTYACGGGAWPPTLAGNVVALYLRGRPPGARPCVSNGLATSADHWGYWEFSLIHEFLHTLGAVAECAPHHARAGHVSDDPRDLMYAGDKPWRPSMLDVGNDDYFNHNTDCLDVAKSVFIDPVAADAVAPPGWNTTKR